MLLIAGCWEDRQPRTYEEGLSAGLEERGGFRVCTAGTAAQARALFALGGAFDAVVLDDRLSDGNGPEFCAEVRRGGDWTPILILSGSAHENDIVRSFDAGADDHLARPVSLAELVARIRSQMRAQVRVTHPNEVLEMAF